MSLCLCVVWLLTGCASLPHNDVKALHNIEPAGRVILLRGYRDWYSAGIDDLAEKLRQQGVAADAFGERQWDDIADALIARRPVGPIVLVGFSYGADNAIALARRLDSAAIGVDLLITLDPVTPPTLPGNVKRCVNFYQPNGVWDAFPWLRGVPLKPNDRTALSNINVRERSDLNQSKMRHSTIANTPAIHAAIVAEIRRCIGHPTAP